MEHRHRPARLPLREAGRVLEGVDGGSPERDSSVLEPAVELLERMTGLVQQAAHAPVHHVRHLGAGVDAAVPEQRVRAHLRRLARLRHESLAEADHDRVVLGQRAGEVPEALAHDVGADRVGGLLRLVQRALVLARTFPEAAEQLRAERGRGGGDGEAARDRPGREGVGRHGVRLRALDAHVLEPQVEPAEHRPRVECPLRDVVPLLVTVHGVPPGRQRSAAGPHFRGLGKKDRRWRASPAGPPKRSTRPPRRGPGRVFQHRARPVPCLVTCRRGPCPRRPSRRS